MGYYELTAKMKLKVVDSHPEPNNCAMIVIFFLCYYRKLFASEKYKQPKIGRIVLHNINKKQKS